MLSSPEESAANAQQSQIEVDAAPREPPIPDNSNVPKPKRLACMICRKRKLKCDGVRPSCSTCSRLGHMCAYDEQRRKSGPKRGYVKALEERLKQVETLLKTQEPRAVAATATASQQPKPMSSLPIHTGPSLNVHTGVPKLSMPTDLGMMAGNDWDVDGAFNPNGSPQQQQQAQPMDEFNFNATMGVNMNNVGGEDFPWEMIGLGLEEPLPPQDTIDELHQVYFEKVHPSLPMIHRYRYLAAMNLAPPRRPPVCLRYAMWTLASSISEKYMGMRDLFYQRARKYVEADYIKGYGEHMISVAHCQAHILLSCYEMRMMYFPRAWINTGSAIRLAQMIGLHRLDGTGLDVKQCLPPPKDWTEREERRRTFWMAFCEDRYASIGTGWPMTIDEKDIMTDLPASDEAYDMSRPEQTLSLQDATGPRGASKLSPFGAVVLLASLFGRNLIHLHRPDADDLDNDLNGPFWKRHRHLDNIILNTSLCLPQHLKLPEGIANPNIVFTNMAIHTSTICLHQAAIFKAEKNKLPASVGAESKVRCITAANEITSIMRTVSHMDLASMNPFISFCLYVAARVFVQYLKSRPDDGQSSDSLRFLLSAMNALKRRNPLTESFLVQLDVDLEALAARIPKLKNAFLRGNDANGGQTGNPANAPCNKTDGLGGMQSYKCHFLKPKDDDGNPVNAPDLVDAIHNTDTIHNIEAVTSAGFNSQNWLSADQSMSGLTPSSGNGIAAAGGLQSIGGSSSRDNQASSGSPDGQSNGPTPNSSTGSGGTQDPRSRLVPGPMGGSGGNSFQASPISPHQNLMSQADASNFFGATSGFTMPSGMNEQQGSFDLSNGWDTMNGQSELPPLGEGVLRAIMDMGSIDAMDLTPWESTNENMGR
ncbi:unnamed protein product [Clonostachys chloroleuca]|uniref:Zn(2)-C6 fungal-type domain-containing protein n=1 Tax=Clonostachys chloroleuca TaxID=1926264 RepID=A0AA35QDF1_9HYPO|nr:unnamed protein product [Clonostachys chloroleuca]